MTEPVEPTERTEPTEDSGGSGDAPDSDDSSQGPPEQTVDDTDAGWGEVPDREVDAHERWLLEQRPPHWG